MKHNQWLLTMHLNTKREFAEVKVSKLHEAFYLLSGIAVDLNLES